MAHADTVMALLAERGFLRHADIRREGVPASVLARLVERGALDRVESRNGVPLGYKAAGAPDFADRDAEPEMAEIAVRHPRAVLCLQSALRLHGMTDDYAADLVGAVPPGANRATTLPCVRLVTWSDPRMAEVGVEEIRLGGLVPARATDPARTLVDLYRPDHGIDPETRTRALSEFCRRHGEEGLSLAARHASRLGMLGRVRDVIQAARELGEWGATRRP